MKKAIFILCIAFSLQSYADIIDFSNMITDTSVKTIELSEEMNMGNERISEQPSVTTEDLPIPPAQTYVISKSTELVFESEDLGKSDFTVDLEAELDAAF